MRFRLLLGIALGAVVVAACSSGPEEGTPTEPRPAEATQTERAAETTPITVPTTGSNRIGGVIPYRGGVQPYVAPQCPSPQLSYFGGPIVMSPIIVPVFWSSNVNPQLTAPTTGMAQFFADVTQSTYWPWLQEYDTVGLAGGTEQAILPGTATAGVVLTPSLCAGTANCTVTDPQIQAELSAQITAGHLPVPQVDCTGNTRTIYMIEFPPNVKVTAAGVGTSCVQFCAYHSTGKYGTPAIPLIYGVLMDEFTAACNNGCGTNATQLENMTDTASHELAESVTDPDVGLDTGGGGYARPAAWGDNHNGCGEIGDICDNDGTGDTIVVSGRSWVVQELWSNKQNKVHQHRHPAGRVLGHDRDQLPPLLLRRQRRRLLGRDVGVRDHEHQRPVRGLRAVYLDE